jgi:hypothetical protein
LICHRPNVRFTLLFSSPVSRSYPFLPSPKISGYHFHGHRRQVTGSGGSPGYGNDSELKRNVSKPRHCINISTFRNIENAGSQGWYSSDGVIAKYIHISGPFASDKQRPKTNPGKDSISDDQTERSIKDRGRKSAYLASRPHRRIRLWHCKIRRNLAIIVEIAPTKSGYQSEPRGRTTDL